MPDLPAPVYAYVHTHLLATRAPAYLLAQRDGRLETWGGDLARYGLVGLQQGVEVESQIYMLTGLLSSENVPLRLPCIETPSGRFVDLHLFPTAAGMGVLFLEATGEELQRRLLQQRRTRWPCCRSTTPPSLAGIRGKTCLLTRCATCAGPC